jgi:hypothetical protein|tara:strand:- start:1264 stop:1758 length:495 start_codon:yes stop_codon:yes gene_type:complete
MPAQYSATDSNTGLEVTVTGEFPEEKDDRVRIARTTNLFTRLMATILSTESTEERNQRFRAIETQLEIADSLIKGDMQAVGDLVRDTLKDMGITEDQVRDAEEQWREQIVNLGGDPDSIENIFPSENIEGAEVGESTLEDLTSEDIENLFDSNSSDDDDKSDEK